MLGLAQFSLQLNICPQRAVRIVEFKAYLCSHAMENK